MSLNRERVVAGLAALIFLFGLYFVVVGVISPAPGVDVPDITIPPDRTTIAKPEFRTFAADDVPGRDPFSVAEGWSQLEVLPLAPPPYPAMAWLVPSLASGPEPGRTGFAYREGAELPAAGAASETEAAPGGEGGQ